MMASLNVMGYHTQCAMVSLLHCMWGLCELLRLIGVHLIFDGFQNLSGTWYCMQHW